MNSSELLFSWIAPEGLFTGVNVTYAVDISGPSVNMSFQTTDTFVLFENDASLDCQVHVFSVVATNAAGSGPVATVEDTIPIC